MSCLREWLSGGAPPCQGGGRGFDPRLALLLIKKDIHLDILFLLSRSAMHFSNACCFAAWVRFLGELKLSSVVPKPRSTGPCGTRLALLDTQLLCCLGSISRRAKALLGRARAKVHWTLWHPSRTLSVSYK